MSEREGPSRWPAWGSRDHLAAPRLGSAGQGVGRSVPDGTWVRARVEVGPGAKGPDGCHDNLLFEKAGPRAASTSIPPHRAAVVTCGGLSPGLNNVIRSLYLELFHNYGVPEVLGIRRGLPRPQPEARQAPRLTSELVDDIHKEGGTMLASSRGEQDMGTMVDFLVDQKIDMLFCVGGDGTLRGAAAIGREVARRGLRSPSWASPRRSTRVAYCTRPRLRPGRRGGEPGCSSSPTSRPRGPRRHRAGEAHGSRRRLHRLWRRAWLAGGRTRPDPEVDFALRAKGACRRPRPAHGRPRYAVIAVAEGAAALLRRRRRPRLRRLRQPPPPRHRRASQGADLCPLRPDRQTRGLEVLRPQLHHPELRARHRRQHPLRPASPPAAHAAMAGKTSVVVSYLNESFVHVPIAMVVGTEAQVDPEGDLWASVLATTGQPARMGRGA